MPGPSGYQRGNAPDRPNPVFIFYESAIKGIGETIRILTDSSQVGYRVEHGQTVAYDKRTGKTLHPVGGPVMLAPVGEPYTSPYAYKPEGTTSIYRLRYTSPTRYGPTDLLAGGPIVPIQRPNITTRLYVTAHSQAYTPTVITESTQLHNYQVSSIAYGTRTHMPAPKSNPPPVTKASAKRTLTHAFDDVKRYHYNYQKAIVKHAQEAGKKAVARLNKSQSQQQAVHQARGEA